ncbi:hypothetical protein PPTG_12300 [Phytophthora nicotianae INRA-310]|uniref:Elicitin-like protein n=1 Tax=Phytophthora nicotianae (strain INRA-310) TaxID=761204 RepID=W2Q8D5_PHYN3|nr:hypothetical protein PPTG_12300 [Phytophthora nicotianae INRA-310]ETN08530.1 hypothetical protein PPTG_12300 [Phytophthora nicotianae INRA-310]
MHHILMRSTCRITLVVIAAILVLVPTVAAKECTFFQRAQLKRVAAVYFSVPDCASGAFDSNNASKSEYCAGDCLKLMRKLLPDIPDCEFDDNNLGESYGILVAWCDETATSDSSSASASSAPDDSNSTTATTATAPNCTVEDVAIINEINLEAEESDYCNGNVSADVITKVAFCADLTCVAYLENMEARLPNCSYEDFNAKHVISEAVALCDDAVVMVPNSTMSPATTPVPTETTIPTPVPSSSNSQAIDTPATTESAGVALNFSASIVVVSSIIVLAWISLGMVSQDKTDDAEASNAKYACLWTPNAHRRIDLDECSEGGLLDYRR